MTDAQNTLKTAQDEAAEIYLPTMPIHYKRVCRAIECAHARDWIGFESALRGLGPLAQKDVRRICEENGLSRNAA